MIIVSSWIEIDPWEERPLVKVPSWRQAPFLNSAMTSSVYRPPIIYAASDVDAVE